MVKALSKMGTEGAFLNIIKATYERPQPTSHSMDKNLELSH